MQVIILAAGLGSRLGDLTEACPKALVKVAGRPLVGYALDFARRTSAQHLRVVGGFHHDEVAKFVREEQPNAKLIENTEFRKGNLLTLLAALEERGSEDGYLVMNTDHIYRPSISAVVADVMRNATEVTAFCDFDRLLTNDDMKVTLTPDADVEKRRVVAMSKQLPKWDCGYVGMTFVPAARAAAHLAAAHRVRETVGEDKAVVEQVLVELARCGEAPVIADISGHGWLEVDEPHERARAEQVLEHERWWSKTATSALPVGQPPKAVMFDLDGTLVDTMQAFADLAAVVMHEQHDADPVEARKRYLETSGLPFCQQLEIIYPGSSLNAAASDTFEERKLEICRRNTIDDRGRETLRELRRRGYKLVLSSNTGQDVVDDFLRREGLDFDLALGFDAALGLAKGGPHAKKAHEHLALAPGEAWFIGDSIKDGELAHENGMPFIGRVGTFTAAQFQQRFPECTTVEHVKDLLELLPSSP